MSAALQPRIYFTEAEYWDREERTEGRSEYYDGQIYAMAGASPRHADISSNINTELNIQLRDRPCRSRASDQRLKVESTGLNTYPDIVVACPPFRYDPQNASTLIDAVVIIEILSRSTASYDRGAKFDHYRCVPSLRHYLLIEQDSIQVEHRFLAGGQWQERTYIRDDDTIVLTEIGCQLVVDELYRNIF